MHKFKALFIVLILLTFSLPTFADEEIKVVRTNLITLKDNYAHHTYAIDFLEPKPFFNEQGILMVPAERYTRSMAIGCRVYNSTDQVRLQVAARELWFTAGSKEYTYKNDAPKKDLTTDTVPLTKIETTATPITTVEVTTVESIDETQAVVETPTTQTLTMETPAVLKDGALYVPLELLCEIFEDDYSWDEADNTAYIKFDRTAIYNQGGTLNVEMFVVPVLCGGFVAYETDGYGFPVVSMSAYYLNSDYEEQLVTMREMLLQVFEEEHVNDAMAYINLENRYTKLEHKAFYNKTKDRIIIIEASHGEVRVDIYFKDLPEIK